jgi:hypothetical protein
MEVKSHHGERDTYEKKEKILVEWEKDYDIKKY